MEPISLLGAKVSKIRIMSSKEAWEAFGDEFSEKPVVIEFDNGVQVYAQADAENNGPGVWVAYDPKTDNLSYMWEYTK